MLQEPIMRNLLLVITALAAVTLLGTRPTLASAEGPWCLIFDQGKERCEFRDFETCQQEATGGKRGFCNQNPRWSGSHASPSPKPRASPKRIQR